MTNSCNDQRSLVYRRSAPQLSSREWIDVRAETRCLSPRLA